MMSNKHNYSQYSNKNKKPAEPVAEAVAEPVVTEPIPVAPVVEEAVVDPIPVAPVVEPEVVEPEIPETVEGVVVNCARLNVRSEPDTTASILCVLDAMSEIEIIVDQSTPEWFKICTATGIEGYCMREYIDACL